MKFMRPTIILYWILFSFSFVVYAQPPIEVIYLKPSDIFYSSREDIDFVHDIMIEVQAFFASEMDRYGFGPKTFDFDSDIKIVRGKQKAEYYDSAEAIQD
ncbi:hypothetical protein F4055_15020, partial [Candidatus Poribacteria bacterium]|nr:hypothetical protein [Candidatus Poribacteria bacterium]